jgi:hypothetical protein
VEYAERTGVATQNAAAGGDAFAGLLADALRDMTTSASLTASTNLSGMSGMSSMSGMFGMPGMSGMPSMPGMPAMSMPGLEQAIMGAVDSGNSNDAMIALFMMMMMMQTNQDGDSSMMMQMMAAMIGSMQNKDEIRHDFLMTSGGDPYTLDTIDANVFNRPMPTLSETGEVVLPLEWWRPTIPVMTNHQGQRNPALYRAVIDQFNVETAERYRPGREGNTYCNIFVWDVTRAMGAELPFYTDPTTGEPRFHPDTQGARMMGAIAMDKWLEEHGAKYGWREVDAATAQMHANTGRPAVTSAGSIGHVQMVVPSQNGAFDPVRGVTIAQAGRTNSNYMHISGIYNAERLNNNIRYWIHA